VGRSDAEVLGIWNAEAHSHSFTEAVEVREFIEAMLSFFEGQAR